MNIYSSLNGGGGNNYLIRTPSLNEHKNILYNSDLNGSITIGNDSTWNKVSIFCWNQDNTIDAGYTKREDNRFNAYENKNEYYWYTSSSTKVYGYRPVIEYRDI